MTHDARVALGALLLARLILLNVYGTLARRSLGAEDETPTPELTAARVCYDCHIDITAHLVYQLEDGRHLANHITIGSESPIQSRCAFQQ